MDFDALLDAFPEITEEHRDKLKESETTEDYNLGLDIEALLEPDSTSQLRRACNDESLDVGWELCYRRVLCTFCQILHELPNRPEVAVAMSVYFDMLGACSPKVQALLFCCAFYRSTMRCLLKVLQLQKSEDEPAPQLDYKPLLRSYVVNLRQIRLGSSYDAISYYLEGFATLATFPADAEVCDLAFRALTLIIEKSTQGPRVMCCYVFRAVLGAILMTQNKNHPANLGKWLYGIRGRATDFVNNLITKYPDLVNPSALYEEKRRKADVQPTQEVKREVKEEPEDRANEVVAVDDSKKDDRAENAEGDSDVEMMKHTTRSKHPIVVDSEEEEEVDYDPYMALIQTMCIQTPDRQDYRQATQETIMGFMKPPLIGRFYRFVQNLSQCEASSRRTIACDMAIALLENKDMEPSSFYELLHIVVDRTRDVMPNVRCKALAGVATGLCSFSPEVLVGALERESADFVDVAKILKACCNDKKPIVRKAALSFFDQLLNTTRACMERDIREIIMSLAQDTSVMVRKAALGSFANLMQHHLADKAVFADWSKAVLPSVADAEASVGDKACELITLEIFKPLIALPHKPFDINDRIYAVLGTLDADGTEFLQRSLTLSLKRNEFKPEALIRGLEFVLRSCLDITIDDWPIDIWSLMEEMTAKLPEKINARLLMEIWHRISDIQDESNTRHSLVLRKTLSLLANVTSQLSATERETLLQLESRITRFSASPDVIKDVMRVLASLRKQSQLEWMNLVARMEEPLMLMSTGIRIHPDLPPRILFTLGEIALAEESVINNNILVALKTLVANAVRNANGEKVLLRDRDRAHGLVALGKLCLRREDLAKQFVEIFVHHLRPDEPFAIRNNALVVLGDLAVHYTSLVDRFVPMMSDCLRDANEVLRLQAVMTLASLLAEEFIKFKGAIMFRLLYGLSDPSERVRYFIESVFSRILLPRNPNIFAQNFLDCVCALNSFSGLPHFQGAVGNEHFSLLDDPSRRTMVYRFMLQKLHLEQRFVVGGAIIQQLLAAFTEGEDPLPIPRHSEPLAAVLMDCLALLACSELRVCFRNKITEEAEDPLEEEVKQKAVQSVLKKNVSEHVVPVLLALRSKLQTQNSPYLRDVNVCLREILKDFKENIAEVVQDPQLAKEVTFDMEQLGTPSQQRQPLLLNPLSVGKPGHRMVDSSNLMLSSGKRRRTMTPPCVVSCSVSPPLCDTPHKKRISDVEKDVAERLSATLAETPVNVRKSLSNILGERRSLEDLSSPVEMSRSVRPRTSIPSSRRSLEPRNEQMVEVDEPA